MRQIALVICLVFFAGIANSQTIDQSKSKVNFSISNMKWKTVEGTISGMKGTINFDKNNLSSSIFNVTIDPNTINTENDTRDDHLRNEDFFNVTKYKTIRFKSYEIVKNGNSYIAKGKMTMHGVTKDVSIPFTIKQTGNKITFTGEIEINRFDYGLGAEKYDGTFMVGKMVNIKITCVVSN